MRIPRIGATFVCAVAVAMSGLSTNAQAAETTTITMTFVGDGCVGCEITPQSLIGTQPDSLYTLGDGADPYVVGQDNTVTFEVPTSATKGMSFVISDPSKADPTHSANFETLIAMQYKGAKPGKRVSTKKAKRGKSASPCWSGTNAEDVTMKVKVRNRKVLGLPAYGYKGMKKVDIPLAWVIPTRKAFGGFTPSAKGVVGAQDIFPCGPSAY